MIVSRIVRRCIYCGKVIQGARPVICPACGGEEWEATSNVIIKGADVEPAPSLGEQPLWARDNHSKGAGL